MNTTIRWQLVARFIHTNTDTSEMCLANRIFFHFFNFITLHFFIAEAKWQSVPIHHCK